MLLELVVHFKSLNNFALMLRFVGIALFGIEERTKQSYQCTKIDCIRFYLMLTHLTASVHYPPNIAF